MVFIECNYLLKWLLFPFSYFSNKLTNISLSIFTFDYYNANVNITSADIYDESYKLIKNKLISSSIK